MIHIAICDDEQYMSHQIRAMISDFFHRKNTDTVILEFSSGEELLECGKEIDILFLDIQMKGLNGMETAKKLRAGKFRGILIFITVLEEMVFQSFEVQAYDYLVKPINKIHFERTMERLFSSIQDARDTSLLEEYINSVVLGMFIVKRGEFRAIADPIRMLSIQLLGTASLFCTLFAYKKLLQSFRLSTELSLLEQQEHSLNQYVEEAKTHYEKTRAFRHDIKNHIMVMKNLLRNGETESALQYIEDLDEMAEKLSFPCNTNNPVVDILTGNKLGIAKSMGINVCCSLRLPYPCGLRDIDICIILSNALDNAIHACKNMEEAADKYIHVTGRIQGDFLFLEVENSFQGTGLFEKGTGLSNIKAIAEKYHGTMSINVQDKVFVLNVLLIIPQGSQSNESGVE